MATGLNPLSLNIFKGRGVMDKTLGCRAEEPSSIPVAPVELISPFARRRWPNSDVEHDVK